MAGIWLIGIALIVVVFLLLERRLDKREERFRLRMDEREERFRQRMDQKGERISQQESRPIQRVDGPDSEMKRQYEALDTRLRTVAQNQARLSGEMSTLREAILLRPAGRE